MRYIVITVAIGFISCSVAQAGLVSWDENDQASARGSGCSRETTAFIQAGNEMSVIFSDLGISLSGRDDPKIARKSCRISIPVRVAANHFLAQLGECLVWGYVQNGDSEGSLRVQSTLGSSRGLIKRQVQRSDRRRNEPYLEAVAKRQVGRHAYCNGRATDTHYRASFDLRAKRRSLDDDLVLQIDGLDIKLQITGSAERCPRRVRGDGRRREYRSCGRGWCARRRAST